MTRIFAEKKFKLGTKLQLDPKLSMFTRSRRNQHFSGVPVHNYVNTRITHLINTPRENSAILV